MKVAISRYQVKITDLIEVSGHGCRYKNRGIYNDIRTNTRARELYVWKFCHQCISVCMKIFSQILENTLSGYMYITKMSTGLLLKESEFQM